MENTVYIWMAGAVLAYLAIRIYLNRNLYKASDYERELLDIMNKDEHKVKGRFE